MDFSFDLTGICAMSPALPDTVSFLSWAEGDGAFPVKEGRVKSPLVPGMLSRRLLPGDLLAVAAMLSLERLAGAVMCDMDEEWQEARYFSKDKMDELYDESRAPRAEEPPTPERMSEWRLVAKRAIESSLELADEMGAA